MKVKDNLLYIFLTIILGAIAGIIVWLFMVILDLGIEFIWDFMKEKISNTFYTVTVCSLGGLLLGVWHKYFGDYPKEMQEVLKTVKKKKRYDYKKILIIIISTLIPIILGASVGPEAGLVGIVACVCTWLCDKIKFLNKNKEELSNIGIISAIGAIFKAPLFGAGYDLEESSLPKTRKVISYICAGLGAFFAFKLLSGIYSTGGLPNFYDVRIKEREFIGFIFLIIAGIAAGYLFIYSSMISEKVFNKIKNPVIKSLIVGIILGIVGTLLPLTMFTGEEQVVFLKENFATVSALILIITALVKLILTNICLYGGFKGGHFFPCIFSAVSLGYGISLLTGLDPIFSIVTLTSSLLGFIMHKRLAVILLLIMFFPPICIIAIIISVFISNLCPLPKESLK